MRSVRWEKPAEPKRGVRDFHNKLPALCAILRILKSPSLIGPFHEGNGYVQRINVSRVWAQMLMVKRSSSLECVLPLRETNGGKLRVHPPTDLSSTGERHASIAQASGLLPKESFLSYLFLIFYLIN